MRCLLAVFAMRTGGAGFHSNRPAQALPIPERGNQSGIIVDNGASTGPATVRFVKSFKDSGCVGDFSKGCFRKMLNNAGMVLFVVRSVLNSWSRILGAIISDLNQ